jgi:hypothetical protein
MNISTTDLARGRVIAGRLLDALGIEAYLYELEPGDTVCELRVECAVADGWKRCAWPVSTQELLASNDDASLRERLLKSWADRLNGCKRV